MNKIAALIDFTPTTDVVLEFASRIAVMTNAEVALVTVTDNNSDAAKRELSDKMNKMSEELQLAGVKCATEIHYGSFFSTIGPVIDRLHASLAIIGTHGKKGLKQNLFGSNILKLVKLLHIPSLVVQDDSVWPERGFANVFFPIAAHSRFKMKIDQTTALMNPAGKISLYAIYKTDNLDEDLNKNIKLCEKEFVERNVNYELIEEEATMYSVGFSRQSLDYVSKHKTDLISIMAQVSKLNKFFGNVDKENIILNSMGIPVLCCNDEEEHF